MALFSKKDDDHHAGSGLDKPDPKSLLQKVSDAFKSDRATKSSEVPPEPREESVTPPVAAAGSD